MGFKIRVWFLRLFVWYHQPTKEQRRQAIRKLEDDGLL